MRIYELAKELKMNSKDLIDIIEKELNVKVNSHMSSITDLETLRIKKIVGILNGEKITMAQIKDKNTSNNKTTKVDTKVQNNNAQKQAFIPKAEMAEDFKGTVDTNAAKTKKTDKKPVNKSNKKPDYSKANRNKNKNNNNNNFKKDNKREGSNKPVSNAPIEIEDTIVVGDLANKLNVPVASIISKLIMLGIMVNMNQEIDFDTASIMAEEFGVTLTKKEIIDELQSIEDALDNDIEDKEEELKERPPIVTVMGHVDHGKTSLLDAIRHTIVTSSEAGGITQHIGASVAEINGKKITFLDTPGHEAFTSMRARGASITDIAILVVAADDGVMPQTIEAINHAKAANVPIIVAVNKIDKEAANIDRVKQELSEQGVFAEDWGGDTIFVPVSAKQKLGIEDLLEMILIVAEMQELKANPNRAARGTIIEAKLDKGRGPVATVLVQKGTLKKGDSVLVGTSYGKIRAMFNSLGKKISQAGPSVPVEILGLSETPLAGDTLVVMDSEKDARTIAEKRREKSRQETMNTTSKVSLDDLFDRIQKGEVKDLNIVLKADVRGSIEAIKQSLEKLSMDEVKVNIIHSGVGGINETDIMLASASNAIVIGFNVRPSIVAIDASKREHVDVRTYNVIYTAIEDIKAAVKGMLDPIYKEVVQGRAEVRATFKVPNVGIVGGVYVLNGKITRKSKVRVLRDNIVIHEGDINSLKRFKDDASELNTGYEGGLGIEKFNDLRVGDVIEAYIMEEVKR